MHLKNKVSNSEIVPIAGDGMLMSPDIGDNKLLPVLILDCASHDELRNLIRVHQSTGAGDVESVWAFKRFSSKKSVFLILEFSKPVEVRAVLKFDLATQAGLADFIIQAKGAYIQVNEKGNKVSDNINEDKIIVEIPAEPPNWDDVLTKQYVASYRTDGLSRTEAKQAASMHINRMRELSTGRLRSKLKAQGIKNIQL